MFGHIVGKHRAQNLKQWLKPECQASNVVEIKFSDRDFVGVAVFLADDPYALISYSQKGDGVEVFLKLINDQQTTA